MPGSLVHFELPADDTKRATEFYGNPISLFQADESVPAPEGPQ
jgi:predicted enzyme related to lactoylglutathione lyase